MGDTKYELVVVERDPNPPEKARVVRWKVDKNTSVPNENTHTVVLKAQKMDVVYAGGTEKGIVSCWVQNNDTHSQLREACSKDQKAWDNAAWLPVNYIFDKRTGGGTQVQNTAPAVPNEPHEKGGPVKMEPTMSPHQCVRIEYQ